MTARADAGARFEDARAFLAAAETIDALNDAESYSDVIATLAVHAGIAASDAFCLLTLGQHSKSENHADAINVLKSAGGDSATLSRLLGEKTKAAYNVKSLTRAKATKCMEWSVSCWPPPRRSTPSRESPACSLTRSSRFPMNLSQA
ncbi:DNA-binding protein [Paenarthrobacter sp. PH39-S1]|uniref:DNA-binding protein n=1 Tax=Paenarthrobacter sp. PH39-S1 TaxID=3046204 RepID=UPI0024B97490|nr:DNA-binding protein [Paenarthrobacter sp. PH39-S1]MDJ0357500.1 DNA-binding protein [Paenarthrobacter sp. PH39-S1]